MASKKAKPVVIVIDGDKIIQTDTAVLNLLSNMAGQMLDDVDDYYKDHPKRARDEVPVLITRISTQTQ